jgi:hypothetical protein
MTVLLAVVAATVLLSLQAFTMKRITLGLLQRELQRTGLARVHLQPWVHNAKDKDTEEEWTIQAQPHDGSSPPCHNHLVPSNLAETMSWLGQWAATQKFAMQRSKEQQQQQQRTNMQEVRLKHAHHNQDPMHIPGDTGSARKTTASDSLSLICQNGSSRWISKNEDWILEHVEMVSNSAEEALVMTPFATTTTFVLVKPIQDDDFVWVLTDLEKAREHLQEYNDSGATKWYAQAYTLSYNNNKGMDNDFCNGMSMIMAMGGFQWSLSKKGDCLTYFVAPWKLSDAGKFQGAMVYSFLLAVLTEGLFSFGGWIKQFLSGKLRIVVMATIYGVQQWLGYIIMLIAMMYSFELMGCVILGLMTGRILFPKAHRVPPKNAPSRMATNQRPNVTTEAAAANNEESSFLEDAGSTVRRRRR